MSVVWEIIKRTEKSSKLADLLLDFDRVLGVKIDEPVIRKEENLPEEITELVEQRKLARQNKNFGESDRIRDVLASKGYKVIDSKEGQKIEKI